MRRVDQLKIHSQKRKTNSVVKEVPDRDRCPQLTGPAFDGALSSAPFSKRPCVDHALSVSSREAHNAEPRIGTAAHMLAGPKNSSRRIPKCRSPKIARVRKVCGDGTECQTAKNNKNKNELPHNDADVNEVVAHPAGRYNVELYPSSRDGTPTAAVLL
eukprot:Gregarina_sp_Poly_1__181@NODE_1041_length_5267_cov_150_372308_g721_i0_p4_GENE_NODE_1041_length_5267_cov_150_372308_g721_i0NODE_1041_length_5267_cov_150_372308_g721_i0_p4_ORF_typecomplete_len158_score21_28DUF5318/PF17249_2/0_026_NODE_1041_length_5267_cov_150_372308_g721_i021522625